MPMVQGIARKLIFGVWDAFGMKCILERDLGTMIICGMFCSKYVSLLV
jgi:hypothetical protein